MTVKRVASPALIPETYCRGFEAGVSWTELYDYDWLQVIIYNHLSAFIFSIMVGIKVQKVEGLGF